MIIVGMVNFSLYSTIVTVSNFCRSWHDWQVISQHINTYLWSCLLKSDEYGNLRCQ